jgi:alpha-L-arabinofuranosidase
LENDKSSVVHYNGWSRETICDSIQCNVLEEKNTVEINTYGDSFKIVLNGVTLHEKLLTLIPHLTAVCTVDEKTLEVITKLVNFSEMEITVNIRTDSDMLNEAKITTLTGDSYYSKNTFENKTAVLPYTERIKASSDYNVVIKPRSVNVIRQKMATKYLNKN